MKLIGRLLLRGLHAVRDRVLLWVFLREAPRNHRVWAVLRNRKPRGEGKAA